MTSKEDIILWSDNTWCYREELHEMTHMSDVSADFSRSGFDFIIIPFGSLYYPDNITIIEPDYDAVVKSRKSYMFSKE
jgi:hypothetical protein